MVRSLRFELTICPLGVERCILKVSKVPGFKYTLLFGDGLVKITFFEYETILVSSTGFEPVSKA
jgi:hypothetical protein